MANSNSRPPNPTPGPAPASRPNGTNGANGINASGGNANGANGANGAKVGARAHSTPLHRLSQLENGASVGEHSPADEDGASAERAGVLALYDVPGARQENEGALESADDASLREFYGRLVTLLTQENAAEAAPKKKRGGLMTALRRRWLPALVLGALAFAGLTQLLKPRQATYSASATLLLPPRQSKSNADPFASPEDTYDTQAQLAIIGSEKIVRAAMAQVPPELRARGWGDPNRDLAGVNVNAMRSDSLISISAASRDPQASLSLVEAMVRAYTDYVRTRYSSNRTENVGVANARAAKTLAELQSARTALRKYKEKTGVFDPVSQQSISSQNIATLDSALDSARRDAAGGAASDAALAELRAKADEARINLQNVLRDFFPDSERAQVAQAQFNRAQAQVSERETQINQVNAQRVAQLESSLREARGQAAALPGVEQTLNQLNQRVAIAQSAYQSAVDRANALNLANGSVAPVAKTLQAPSWSDDRRMQKIRSLAVSLFAALGLAVMCALVLERLDRSVRAATDPEALFDAPILGALPAVRARKNLFIGNAQNSGSNRARTATIEACYTAQTHILSAAAALGARSILVTSSVPEEGKSQCAANLAAAMAFGGRQVLLIDADFWHPSQNAIFEQELDPGYAQVLRNEIALSQAIRPTNVPNLHLLTAGQKVAPGAAPDQWGSSVSMSALLRDENHADMVEIFKRYFDVILVDAPPTLTMADAQLLSGLTDAVVLVAADRTARDQVQRARSMLRLSGATLLGVIVNSVRLGEVERWNLNFTPEEPFREYSSLL